MGKKLTFEYVKKYFEEQGCELLEKEYKNNYTKMKYKCSCNNISLIKFNNFESGERCRKCGTKSRINKTKPTFEYIKNYFKDRGCELLEKTYGNRRSLLKFKCNCGNIGTTRFSYFKEGRRCRKCTVKKMTGKNNHNYNPNLSDEDRGKVRKKIGYRKWRTKVYKKDNYTCQKCFKRGVKLNAHHIASWDNNEELRLKVFNGLTLCEKCHKKFHKIYGRGGNDEQQLEIYLKTS